MLKQNTQVYFNFNNEIKMGYVGAMDLYKDAEFGQKYVITLDEPIIHDNEEYNNLSIPETELYSTREKLLEQTQ